MLQPSVDAPSGAWSTVGQPRSGSPTGSPSLSNSSNAARSASLVSTPSGRRCDRINHATPFPLSSPAVRHLPGKRGRHLPDPQAPGRLARAARARERHPAHAAALARRVGRDSRLPGGGTGCLTQASHRTTVATPWRSHSTACSVVTTGRPALSTGRASRSAHAAGSNNLSFFLTTRRRQRLLSNAEQG